MTGCRRLLNYVLLCLAALLLTIALFKRFQNSQIDAHVGVPKRPTTEHLIPPDAQRELTSCVLSAGIETHWGSLVERTNTCVTKFSNITSDSFVKFHMGRFDELKVFLPMLREYAGPCYELTIGIGGDTQVEKEFRHRYPKCKIFGIEPSSDTANFSSYGTVIPHAAGIVEGRLPMAMRGGDGSYVTKEVDVVPLPKLLDKYVVSRVVHFVTIDIEGFDYNLLDAFRYKQPFDRAGIVFCQIDVELHGKEKQMEGFDFEKFLPDFLSNSPYVPVFASNFLNIHIKLTLLHSRSYECQEMFGFSSYFMR